MMLRGLISLGLQDTEFLTHEMIGWLTDSGLKANPL